MDVLSAINVESDLDPKREVELFVIGIDCLMCRWYICVMEVVKPVFAVITLHCRPSASFPMTYAPFLPHICSAWHTVGYFTLPALRYFLAHSLRRSHHIHVNWHPCRDTSWLQPPTYSCVNGLLSRVSQTEGDGVTWLVSAQQVGALNHCWLIDVSEHGVKYLVMAQQVGALNHCWLIDVSEHGGKYLVMAQLVGALNHGWLIDVSEHGVKYLVMAQHVGALNHCRLIGVSEHGVRYLYLIVMVAEYVGRRDPVVTNIQWLPLTPRWTLVKNYKSRALV